VPDPFGAEGSRLYRTGDRGRLRADGVFEFLGRLDDQVKIRGFRVEPGEVESALDALPQVRRSVVTATYSPAAGRQLVAYVDATGPVAEIRRALARVLPEHMVPSAFVPVEAIPLNRNGKVDRAALTDTATAVRAAASAARRQPATDTERRVGELVADVLGTTADAVWAYDELFALGLDSLTAVRLLAEVRRRLGVKVELRRFLRDATLDGLIALVTAPGTAEPPSEAPVIRSFSSAGTGEPLYCFHPLGGAGLCYAGLAAGLAARRPLHAVQALGTDVQAGSPRSMAARYARELVASAGEGAPPYTLAGWSAGGVLAFETACQLTALGHRVGRVVLIDSMLPEVVHPSVYGELVEQLDALGGRVAGQDMEVVQDVLRKSQNAIYDGLGVTPEQAAAHYGRTDRSCSGSGATAWRAWPPTARGRSTGR
jgi:aryl carrier-like protein